MGVCPFHFLFHIVDIYFILEHFILEQIPVAHNYLHMLLGYTYVIDQVLTFILAQIPAIATSS